MHCDRCDVMKNGVYWVQFNNEDNDVMRMCRKCRNQYRDLIHIPLWYMGGCQLEKFEALINDFHYEEYRAEILNEQHADLTGDTIPIHIILPPVIQYYGIRVSFTNDQFRNN